MEANFIINDFEGPLDLLLHLIKTSKMDIYDIKIEEITKQYVDFINKMQELNLDVASEYLVMASELTLIKSKMLLPRNNEEEEEEDPRENLVNRLVEYQRYKDMIDEFKSLERDRKDIFTKDPMNLYEYSDPIKNDGDITLENLVDALNKFLQRKEDEKPLETKIARKEILVTDRTNEIRSLLKKKKKISFFDLFEIRTKEYVVVTFLSILEMAKEGEITITQENNFNNITVNYKEGEELD
ncbi:MAG: segregation/condensation protein A [Bacilli bacterium]|nr:segregation/condensation protein A [Bacilli bacterium]